jgi:hypothetical protein
MVITQATARALLAALKECVAELNGFCADDGADTQGITKERVKRCLKLIARAEAGK